MLMNLSFTGAVPPWFQNYSPIQLSVAVRSSELNDCPNDIDPIAIAQAEKAERDLGYCVASGRKCEASSRFDAVELHRIDALWAPTERAMRSVVV